MREILFLANLIVTVVLTHALQQSDLDYMGENVDVKFEVVSNLNGVDTDFIARITLTNTGDKRIDKDNWEIFFNCVYMLEPDHDVIGGYDFPGSGFRFKHITGGLFKMSPNDEYETLLPFGTTKSFEFKIQNWSVSRTDFMPNWFVSSTDPVLIAKPIASTSNIKDFVGDFKKEKQYKRYAADRYAPYQPQDRFDVYKQTGANLARKWVIPEPVYLVELETNERRNMAKKRKYFKTTKVICHGVLQDDCSKYEDLFNGINDKLKSRSAAVNDDVYHIIINQGDVDLDMTNLIESESYEIIMDSSSANITAPTPIGTWYASQTLASFSPHYSFEDGWFAPSLHIKDAPRFGYRGFSMDVARNFRPKEEIIQTLQMMSQYKLNKLHLRLSDDEGWRLQLDCCEELTRVGSIRSYNNNGTISSIAPQLGSGPTGERLYYTIEDYKEILQEAEIMKIQVIPEFDLPGHAHAAIMSNLAKYNEMAESDPTGAEQVLISDLEDTTGALSVQMFIDNAVNPCINGTYNFVRAVVNDLHEMHSGIQDLKLFHIGGDEIADAWTESPKCLEFLEKNKLENNTDLPTSLDDLKQYFMKRAGEMVLEVNGSLDVGVWEDGAINGTKPYNKDKLFKNDVYGYAWQNTWEWGVADRAYNLANAGYKVVLSQATHLYFDQPYEPDPEERGYYWASRYTNLRKVFGFMPDDVYANADAKISGEPYPENEMCNDFACEQLEKPENIVGMQGSVFSETVRTKEDFHYMVYPRILALAERAWHKASWEQDSEHDLDEKSRNEDYARFVQFLDQNEFARLNYDNILFRMSPPAARFSSGKVETGCEFSSFAIQYRKEEYEIWNEVECGEPINTEGKSSTFELRTIDRKTQRFSRSVTLFVNSAQTNIVSLLITIICTTITCVLVV